MYVTEAVKNAYKEDSIHKEVIIRFPELNVEVGNEQIYDDSLSLEEAILEKDNIEFVGCIASCFKIQIHGLKQDISGKKMEVSINSGKTGEVKLFSGIVDSVVMQIDEQYKKIKAYDELYEKGKKDVATWYNSLAFPISQKELRDSLFEYIGITQVEISLPNDEVSISRQYEPKTLKALNVIKAICQLNGAFGIINRGGLFEYRILGSISGKSGAFPGVTLIPPFYPGVISGSGSAASMNNEAFSFYKKVDYQEYEVKPVDKVTIRQSENVAGVTYGSGINNYIIQGNMFTYGLTEDVLSEIAAKVYESIHGVVYHPFSSDNNGLPFVECGLDTVRYYVSKVNEDGQLEYEAKDFYVFKREMKGIQCLRDSYGANGEEYQTEFITDLQTQIDVIKQDVKQEVDKAISEYDFSTQFGEYAYDKKYIDEKFDEIEQWNHVLVDAVPETVAPMTIYYVKGEAVVN